jgi:ABC-type multidrug transport system ATPase subunit
MVVHTDAVWKRFGRVAVLQGLSFAVPDGSTLALVGANGAGKTTTIKVLMNLLEPTAGTATVLGVDSRRLSPKEFGRIGYVSEHQEMPRRMTVSAYLDYLRPFYPTWDRAREAEIISQFRLPPDRRIGDLSHGMRMKMALACALPFRPALLVLDEPLTGLDPLVRDEFIESLRQQAGETTILVSSHELSEIEPITTHVAFLDRGRVLFQEALGDLAARLRRVRVTLATGVPLPARLPKEWLDMRADGNVLSFLDTRFSAPDLPAKVAAAVGAVDRIDVQPVPLRTIYTSLARAVRDELTPS